MKYELLIGTVGTVLSATGTTIQTNEILKTISLILTIVGALLTYIVIPLFIWYKNAKKDGKITDDEIEEGLKILDKGTKKVDKTVKKEEEK
jgi:high-affinity nickel permease